MADESVPAQRISTSLETLRTEIRLANAELELRIVDRMASKEEVKRLNDWMDDMQTTVDALGEDKAGREAVRNVTRYFIGGGVLTTLIMVAQLVLTFYLVKTGAK